MVNFVIIIVILLLTGWMKILGWVDRDVQAKGLPDREYWDTLVFLTGPVGLFMYLSKHQRKTFKCPNCHKKLLTLDMPTCPYCKAPLNEKDKNPFIDLLDKFDENSLRVTGKEESSLLMMQDSQEKRSSIKAVKMILAEALEQGATDIHLEPDGKQLRIRFRHDGALKEFHTPPEDIQTAVIPCLKAMADLDVAERRKPMDGRMQVNYDKRRTDIRVSTSPTIHGEKVALRILDREKSLLEISNLGMNKEIEDLFKKTLLSPQGMVLATGPTGSGKTTSLYAALTIIDSTANNIMTIEDPVEYQLEGVTQIPINPRAEVTFASGLRSILRQDPDIIMVGEIRDRETADIAIHAALTGHLIFSSLHTNDAVRAITRLMDIGIEPYLISGSVLAILAQRLVRLNCPHCLISENPSDETLMQYKIPLEKKKKFLKGKGCELCGFTGFTGRTGTFEILVMNDSLRQMIDAKASAVTLQEEAIRSGMRTMFDDGIEKALQGKVSLAELTSSVEYH